MQQLQQRQQIAPNSTGNLALHHRYDAYHYSSPQLLRQPYDYVASPLTDLPYKESSPMLVPIGIPGVPMYQSEYQQQPPVDVYKTAPPLRQATPPYSDDRALLRSAGSMLSPDGYGVAPAAPTVRGEAAEAYPTISEIPLPRSGSIHPRTRLTNVAPVAPSNAALPEVSMRQTIIK